MEKMKLSKSIIAKYGITKKAWAMQKKGKSQVKKKMAKKKKGSKGSRSAGMPSWAKTLVSASVAVGYGAVRNKLAEKIPPIPKAQNYSDEIVLGGASLVLSMLPMGKAGKYVRLATKPITDIEMGKIGEKLGNKVPLGN